MNQRLQARAVAALLLARCAAAGFNGMARTPPMGWRECRLSAEKRATSEDALLTDPSASCLASPSPREAIFQ